MKVLVVVYNMHLSDSQTIRSISGVEGIDVYIADNSTSDYGNKKFASANGYHYFDMGGNAGLSRAYNRVISALEKNDDIICLFDDDTTIDRTYFDVLRKEADKYKNIDIFAPVVKDAKGILSPCIMSGLKGKRIKLLKDMPQHKISAVNTGLAIRLKVFSGYKYDEGLFLDYVDHAFIRDIADNETSKIRILNVTLEQRFADNEKTTREDSIKRFNIFKKDVRYFCSKYGISSVRCRMFLLARRAHIMLKNIL